MSEAWRGPMLPSVLVSPHRLLSAALAVTLACAHSASAASFPTEYRFRSLRTSRVTIHFHQGLEPMAREAALLTLRDEAGKVVAVQRFDSLSKAQEFAGDVSQWQRRAERLAGGQFVVRAQRL